MVKSFITWAHGDTLKNAAIYHGILILLNVGTVVKSCSIFIAKAPEAIL
jgi:hypothetical protein